MPEDKRVDPRYDAAFQRGFEGTVASGLRSRAVQRPELVTPAPFRGAEVEAQSEQPREALPREASSRDDDTARDSQQRPVQLTRSAEFEESAVADDLAVANPRRLSRNPFLLALVLLGAGMTVGGIAWANQARMLVATRGGAATDLDYWFLQASVVAAPLTIIAGIGILAGVLFIAAVAWNRRP